MSSDEQFLAIGKLVSERSQKRRESALLAQEIHDTGKEVYRIGLLLERPDMHLIIDGTVLTAVDQLIDKGGLDKLKRVIVEYRQLQARISEVSASLSQAGAGGE